MNSQEVINPYLNQEVLVHRKYISHFGIAFLDLMFTDQGVGKGGRTVLRKICGQVNYGTLIAILGPRQSGKTTLLKCLSGRANQGIDYETQFYLSGDIPVRAVFLEKEIENNILLSLTVEEALLYSFCFRNPNVPAEQRMKVINGLIKDLSLAEVFEMPLRACTAEEQVRAEIAMALATLNRSNILFMDEPLSQLDAVSIDNIVHLMKGLCRSYAITFVCSIGNVPDSDILTTFDKLYVLSRGGFCVYEGSADHLGLFLRESEVFITSKIETPMERLMKVAAKPDQTTIRLAQRTYSTRDEIFDMALKYGEAAPNGVQTPLAPGNIDSMWLHLSRCTLHKYRLYWKSLSIYFGLIIALTFALASAFPQEIGLPDSCINRTSKQTLGKVIMSRRAVDEIRNLDQRFEVLYDEQLIEDNLKFIFISLLGLTLLQMITSIRVSHDEIRVAVNEHRNGWININIYLLMKTLVELVVPFANTMLFAVLAFFLTGQKYSEWRFLLFFFAFFMAVLCAQGLGFMIGIISVFNEKYIHQLAIVSYTVLVVFSGYLMPLDKLGDYPRVLSNISFLKQAFELSLYSIYGFGRCDGHPQGRSSVLAEYGLDGPNVLLINCLIIVGYFLVLRSTVFFILMYKSNKTTTIDRPGGSGSGSGGLNEHADQLGEADGGEPKFRV